MNRRELREWLEERLLLNPTLARDERVSVMLDILDEEPDFKPAILPVKPAELGDLLEPLIPPDLTATPKKQLSRRELFNLRVLIQQAQIQGRLSKPSVEVEGQPLPSLALEIMTLEPPLVRQMRKQWGGVPRVQTHVADFDARRALGYAKRSLGYKAPSITLLTVKQDLERLKRSLAHTRIKAEVSLIETVNLNLEQALFYAYSDFAKQLLANEHRTAAMVDAWDEYIPDNMIDAFITETYEPTIRAFSKLEDSIKDFIAEAWDRYGKAARVARQGRYDMNLTAEQINDLQDADKSYLD